eukprot:9879793-Lingulodinium_polyedra.AAC.1
MNCPWAIHEQSMNSPWAGHGVHGQPMASAKTIQPLAMNNPWTTHGQSVYRPWTGRCMDNQWAINEQRVQHMDCPWTAHGQYAGNARTIHGLSMD